MDGGVGLLQTLKLHTGDVTSCDLSLNYLLAIGSSDKVVRVLEWKTGLGFVDMSYSPLKHHKHGVTSVRFSPKGTMLASSSLDGTALLFNVSTGTIIFTMVQYNTTSIRCCEFTFNSTKLITAGDDGVFCFWDLVRRAQMRNCRLHEEEFCMRALTVSPDSEFMLSADSGNFLKLWFIGNVSDTQPRCLFIKKNFHDGIFSCDFSPAVETTGDPLVKYRYFVVTCGADSLIKVWQIMVERNADPKCLTCEMTLLQDLKGHKNDVLSVRFNPTGNFIVSTGLDNLIKLWERFTGKCVETLPGHTSFGTCSAYSKDSMLLVTGSNDKTAIIWDLTQNLTLDSQLIRPCNASSHFTNINLINYSANSKNADQGMKLNDQFNVIQKLDSSAVINSVQMQGNILAVAGGDKRVTIWKRKEDDFTFELTESVEHHKYSINHLEISPCGSKIISSARDGVVLFWDLNMKLTHEMKTPACTNSLRTCRFSPNSSFIAAAGDDQEVFLWNASDLEFVKVIQRHENAVTSVAFTPDSKFLVSTCCGGDVKLYNFERDQTVFEMNSVHDLGAMSCDFSFVGLLKQDSVERLSTSGMDFKKNYLLATCGNDSLVNLWEVKDSEMRIHGHLAGHKGMVNCVRFSSGEPFILASCASDKTIRIWHVKIKQCLHVLNHHQSTVTTCSFSQDSSLFATGSLDKSVLIWQLNRKFFHEPTEITQNSSRLIHNWTVADIANWFLEMGCPEFVDDITKIKLDGRKLLSISDLLIEDEIGLENEKDCRALKRHLHWLRRESQYFTFDNIPITENVPHKFLCPITHKIMRNPVICSDGYTYDKQAITEWFLSGEFTSPVTKECLTNTRLLPYSALKKNIFEFLYKSEQKK